MIKKIITNNEAICDKLYLPFGGEVRSLCDIAYGNDLRGGLFCGVRTYEEQAALYAKGRTAPGNKVTNAKPGDSYHNFGLAVDWVWLDDDYNWTWEASQADWNALGLIAKNLGLEWGGDWKGFVDKPHIQCTFNLSTRRLDAQYKKVGGNMQKLYGWVDEVGV